MKTQSLITTSPARQENGPKRSTLVQWVLLKPFAHQTTPTNSSTKPTDLASQIIGQSMDSWSFPMRDRYYAIIAEFPLTRETNASSRCKTRQRADRTTYTQTGEKSCPTTKQQSNYNQPKGCHTNRTKNILTMMRFGPNYSRHIANKSQIQKKKTSAGTTTTTHLFRVINT